MKLLFTLILPLLAYTAIAQARRKQLHSKPVPPATIEHARFDDIANYMSHNLHYPDVAFESSVEGKIIVRFLVNEKGQIDNATILKDPMGCKSCEAEALRVVRYMPLWKPAMYKNKSVAEVKVLPVQFRIDR